MILAVFALSLSPVFLFKWVNPPFTPLMVIRSGQGVSMNSTPRKWTELDKISPYVLKALIASEDYRFFKHNGFDVNALRYAYRHNQKSKLKIGGSTISQQTAKNIFLWPHKSYIRKSIEAYYTFWIELLWGKKRILEVYLNSIEMGKGIYGIGQASKFHFKSNPKDLNLKQAASLVLTFPNPLKRSPKTSPRKFGNKYRRLLKESPQVRIPK